MKIYAGKIKTSWAVKWMEYFAAAYLLASWGVNGIVNPLHYIRNLEGQTVQLSVEECADGIVIWPQESAAGQASRLKADGIDAGYLSFYISQSDRFSFQIKLLGYPEAEKTRGRKEAADVKEAGNVKEAADVIKAELKAWKGFNTADLGRIQDGKVFKEIIIPKSTLESEGIVIESAQWSEYRRVDTGRMVYLMAAFLILAALWEGVWWMKKRYAD